MRVIGVDFSSFFIDVVAIHVDDLEPPEWTRFALEGQDAFDRTRTVGAVMPSRSARFWDDVVAVGIEHPAGPPTTVLAPMRVQGAVLSMIPSGWLLVHPWPPSAWRKAVGLPGNASKDNVADWVLSKNGGEYGLASLWEQDACDAYCIALATRQAITTD